MPCRATLCHHSCPKNGCQSMRLDRLSLKAALHCLQGFPSWQVLLVDIRCHGESAKLPTPAGPHGVESSAKDILQLLSQLKLFPEVLIGHSFGGKVVLSMGEQFGASGNRLPRPVQVSHPSGTWAYCLNTLPSLSCMPAARLGQALLRLARQRYPITMQTHCCGFPSCKVAMTCATLCHVRVYVSVLFLVNWHLQRVCMLP